MLTVNLINVCNCDKGIYSLHWKWLGLRHSIEHIKLPPFPWLDILNSYKMSAKWHEHLYQVVPKFYFELCSQNNANNNSKTPTWLHIATTTYQVQFVFCHCQGTRNTVKTRREKKCDVTTLVMLNKLRCYAHFLFSANHITWFGFLIEIHIFNDKQSRSRSVGFFRSQLIWIYTVC